MYLQSSIGSLTVVNANLANPSFFWRGEQLANVLSGTSFYNPPASPKVTIRVINPAKVVPSLPATEQMRLTAIYDEMAASGIMVHKV